MSQGVNGEGEDGMECGYPEQFPSVASRSLTVSPHCVWRSSTTHQQHFYLTFILHTVHIWPAVLTACKILTYPLSLQHRHNLLLNFI